MVMRVVMVEFVRRHFLVAVAAIFAGAVASVIWEVIVTPSIIWFSGLLMTLGTLGIATLRDNVYIEVARGLHEDPSITLVAMAIGVLGVVLFILVRGIITKPTEHADFESVNSDRPSRHLERIWQRTTAPNARLSGLRRTALGTNVVLFILCLILLSRLFYINRAIVYFRQCFDAATPALTEQEEEEVLGQFSSMRTRAEFAEVTTRLEHVAHSHGKRTPEFILW